MNKDFSVVEEAKMAFRASFRQFGLLFAVSLIVVAAGLLFYYFGHILPLNCSFAQVGLWCKRNIDLSGTTLARLMGLITIAFVLAQWTVFFTVWRSIVVGGLFLGQARVSLDVVDRKKSALSRLFSSFSLLGKYVVGSVVEMLILLGAGLLSFIVGLEVASLLERLMILPAGLSLEYIFSGFIFSLFLLAAGLCFFAARLSLWIYYLVDKNLEGSDAVIASFHTTRGYFWKLFGALVLSALLSLTVIGMPIVHVMWASIYRKLS